MKKIYVLTDAYNGTVGAYDTNDAALSAAETYEDKNWASADTRSDYEEEYPNGEISYGEYLIKIHDYSIEEVEYWGV